MYASELQATGCEVKMKAVWLVQQGPAHSTLGPEVSSV